MSSMREMVFPVIIECLLNFSEILFKSLSLESPLRREVSVYIEVKHLFECSRVLIALGLKFSPFLRF